MTLTRLVPGIALVGAAAAAYLNASEAIWAGHPAYLIWLGIAAAFGIGLTLGGLFGRKPTSGPIVTILRWLGALVGVGFAVLTYWLSPYPVEVPDQAILQSDDRVVVADSTTALFLTPTGRTARTGIAFIPGALVDPRAYIPLLRPLVAAGYPVYIAKPALGIAFAVPNVTSDGQAAAAEAGLDVNRWVVAGHSLGGAVGSGQVDANAAAGLILLGAYPIADIHTSKVDALSIYGSNDALTTPEDVAANRALLPKDTRYAEIEGGIHSYFGDYGIQRGDGEPGTTREDAQRQTRAAMAAFLVAINRTG